MMIWQCTVGGDARPTKISWKFLVVQREICMSELKKGSHLTSIDLELQCLNMFHFVYHVLNLVSSALTANSYFGYNSSTGNLLPLSYRESTDIIDAKMGLESETWEERGRTLRLYWINFTRSLIGGQFEIRTNSTQIFFLETWIITLQFQSSS